MPAGPVDHRPDTRLGWVLGIVVVVAALAPVAIAAVAGDRLPTDIPRQYAPNGDPTALWPRWTSIAFVAGLTLVVGGGCAAAAVLLRLPLAGRRGLAWIATWVTVLLAGLKVGILVELLDTTDPLARAPVSGIAARALLVGMVLGIPVAALARETSHGQTTDGPPPADLPRLPTGQPPRWRSAPLTSRALLVVLAATGTLLLVPAVLLGLFTDGLLLALLAVASLAPALLFARVRVDIDDDGLHVRGSGVRFLHVPIAEVARADVVDHIDPFWEFGGWGLRVDVHGRTGVVSRAGPALRVVRGDGTEVLLTVDDAATAAATLLTLADRYHRHGG